MIDETCFIYKTGGGYCWAPSTAWNCTDCELCVKCKLNYEKKQGFSEKVTEVTMVKEARIVYTEPEPVEVKEKRDRSKKHTPCNRCGRPVRKNRPMCAICANKSYIPRTRGGVAKQADATDLKSVD